MTKLKRKIDMFPSYDERENPKGNYGIGAVKIRFALIGEKGAVTFSLYTDWFIESARQHLKKFNHISENKPNVMDFSWHFFQEKEDCDMQFNECDLSPTKKCWFNSSGIYGKKYLEGFLSGGSDYVWECLEKEYKENIG